jgi:hypothetical protein
VCAFFCCSFDCGYHTLFNVENWNGQNIPAISKEDVVKLRRVFPYNWLTADFNEERDNWRLIIFNNLKR